MKRKREKVLLSLFYIICCLAAAIVPSVYVVRTDRETVSSDIIFSVNGSADVNAVIAKYSGTYEFNNVRRLFADEAGDGNDVYYSARIDWDGLRSEEDVIGALKSDGVFGVVEPDCEFLADAIPDGSIDRYMKDQWYLDRTGAKQAWPMLDGAPGEDVVVAVIDTGVNYMHPDIKRNMWINEKEYFGIPGYDDDGNGIADDIYGADIIGGTSDVSDSDEYGHGTHVAGIIAMTAGNGGGCGIAYGAKIMAVKAGSSEGTFKMSDVIKAVNYAVETGADVINMSFGTYAESEAVRAVMEKASRKCILVAAAGNESFSNTEGDGENGKNAYPAAYPFVIGVMAEDQNGLITSWSNYDSEPHSMIEYEMSAPGFDILSSAAGNRYAYMSGTSMAAPMVSAAAAILYSSAGANGTDDILNNVVGRLTQGGSQYSAKTTADGRTIRYKSLNIADALSAEPGINIEIGNIMFKDTAGTGTFRDAYTFSDGGRKELRCGFVVDNAWSGAKDVSVKVSSSDGRLRINGGDIHIGDMEACSKLDLGFDDGGAKNGAFSLIFDTEINKTYTFSLTFDITGTMAGAAGTVCRKSFSRAFTINVKEAVKDDTAAMSTPILTPPTRPAIKASGSYIDILWDNILCADGYHVYRSEKQGTGYERIASVKSSDALSYRDKSTKTGVKYYYKVKAYFGDGKESPYSEAVYGIRPGRVKGLTYKRGMHKTKYENCVSWKQLKGVSKYVIYYSDKKSGGFKKLAATSKRKYRHRFSVKKTYYYKIRAYAQCSTGKAYGKYSKVIKVKR